MKYFAVLCVVCVLNAEAPCPDTELKLSAVCTITGIKNVGKGTSATWTDSCFLETMTPADGFNNLYRVVVSLSEKSPVKMDLPPIVDMVKAQNSAAGNVTIGSVLWGSIVVSPTCPAIRRSIATRAPAFEIRPQVLFVSLLDKETLEIRIEERWGDFYGGVPSPDWLTRHLASFKLLSNSK